MAVWPAILLHDSSFASFLAFAFAVFLAAWRAAAFGVALAIEMIEPAAFNVPGFLHPTECLSSLPVNSGSFTIDMKEVSCGGFKIEYNVVLLLCRVSLSSSVRSSTAWCDS
jgi:hypothetical protein